jgi:hypothetical protein
LVNHADPVSHGNRPLGLGSTNRVEEPLTTNMPNVGALEKETSSRSVEKAPKRCRA